MANKYEWMERFREQNRFIGQELDKQEKAAAEAWKRTHSRKHLDRLDSPLA